LSSKAVFPLDTPTVGFAADFRVITMDQRNADGQSRVPITAQDGRDAYRQMTSPSSTAAVSLSAISMVSASAYRSS
jgi:hypothetical protein